MPEEREWHDGTTESRKLMDAAIEAVMAFVVSTDTGDLPRILNVVILLENKDSGEVIRYYPIRAVLPAKETQNGA